MESQYNGFESREVKFLLIHLERFSDIAAVLSCRRFHLCESVETKILYSTHRKVTIGYFHKLRIEVKMYERFKVYTSDAGNRTKNVKILYFHL